MTNETRDMINPTLDAARGKLAALGRTSKKTAVGVTDLGMPAGAGSRRKPPGSSLDQLRKMDRMLGELSKR
jgi:hypothetical protein